MLFFPLRAGSNRALTYTTNGGCRRIDRARTFFHFFGARGETIEQMRKSINLEEFTGGLAGDSRVRRDIFDSYVTGAARRRLRGRTAKR